VAGPDAASPRMILSAELVAVGSELVAGETRDSNGGELAASLASAGVSVRRITALPDDLELVTARFREALASVDLTVATGGLGPTPDDLTREALAASLGEEPRIDPTQEALLRELFSRRGMQLPEVNLKQAWLIPSATAIPNGNGTAPGWWVDGPAGRVAVLLPGPPREMRPMWQDWVVPMLRERGLGDGRVVRTLRTYGIGESLVVERLGESLFRRSNPIVATYAGAEWLDIRISGLDEPAVGGMRRAADVVAEAEARIRDMLGGSVWAEGRTTWADLATAALEEAGVRIAAIDAGTRGQLGSLLADVPGLAKSVALSGDGAADALDAHLEAAAEEVAREAGVNVGVALVARDDGRHTAVRVVVVDNSERWSRGLELVLFQHGAHGRLRAAVAGVAFVIETLREAPQPGSHASRTA